MSQKQNIAYVSDLEHIEVPQPSDATPLLAGAAAAGSSEEYSRGDHVHPAETNVIPAGYELRADNLPMVVSLNSGETISYSSNAELTFTAEGNPPTVSMYDNKQGGSGYLIGTFSGIPLELEAVGPDVSSIVFNDLHGGDLVDRATQVSVRSVPVPTLSQVTAIESVIPSAASDDNQLADKSFVNNQVSTNSANYISYYDSETETYGPFPSLEALEAYSGTLTNNDYAFVATTDQSGDTTYTRYKYNAGDEQWGEEYVIHNPTFSADQWAAINSGITSNKLSTLTAQGAKADTALQKTGGQMTGSLSFSENGQGVTPTVGWGPADNFWQLSRTPAPMNGSPVAGDPMFLHVRNVGGSLDTSLVSIPFGKSGALVTEGDIAGKANRSELCSAWAANTAYDTNSFVIHDNAIYRCTAAHTSGQSWDASKWAQTTIAEIISRYLPLSGGRMNGDLVFERGKILSFEFTMGSVDICANDNHGLEIRLIVDDELVEKLWLDDIATLASPAFTGTPTAPDIGVGTSSQVSTKNYVDGKMRYDLIVDAQTLTLGDRAVQKVTLNAASTTLTLPALTSGKTADFVLGVINGYEVSGTPTAANFILAGTIGTDYNIIVPKGEDWSEMSALEAGEMAEYYFTLSAFALGGLPTWKIVKQPVEQYTLPAVTP